MPVHAGVHGGSQQQRAGCRQGGEGQQGVCPSLRQLGKGVGGSRGDHQQIGSMGQADVQHVRFRSPQIRPGVGPPPGHRLEGQGADEALRRLGQQHIDLRPCLREPGGQIGGLVGGDRAGHAEQDAAMLQHGDHLVPLHMAWRTAASLRYT